MITVIPLHMCTHYYKCASCHGNMYIIYLNFKICIKYVLQPTQDLHLDYECVCGPDFDGRFCEIELDGCVGQTCYNNGTCHVSITCYY